MKKIQSLGDFEQVLLLAILRVQEQGAYGVSIRKEIAIRTQRQPTPGATYTTLDRLEEKNLVSSHVGEATPERGGRAKRYYKVTAQGLSALQRTQNDYRSLLQGLSILGESHA